MSGNSVRSSYDKKMLSLNRRVDALDRLIKRSDSADWRLLAERAALLWVIQFVEDNEDQALTHIHDRRVAEGYYEREGANR